MTEARSPSSDAITEADVARMREVYFAPREVGVSDLGIRLILGTFSLSLLGELRRELARADADPQVLDDIFRRVEG